MWAEIKLYTSFLLTKNWFKTRDRLMHEYVWTEEILLYLHIPKFFIKSY